MLNDYFIWTEKNKKQICRKTQFDKSVKANYKIYRFKKDYSFDKKIKSLKFDLFADTKYFLYVNGSFAGFGPVCPGGDYGSSLVMPVRYYDSYSLPVAGNSLEFEILVQQDIVVQTDMSVGFGGLAVFGRVIFEDDTEETIKTDTSWLVCEDERFKEAGSYDYSAAIPIYKEAVGQNAPWSLRLSEIKHLKRSAVKTDFKEICVQGNSEKTVVISADKIYSVFLLLDIVANGKFEITAEMSEDGVRTFQFQRIVGECSVLHRSLIIASASSCRLTICNKSDNLLVIKDAEFEYVRYPEDNAGSFACSDNLLNKIYDVGRHTLEICRNTIHLDSPAHQETLGCSGDYFIQSLIEYYIHADTRLIRFDIIRIADYLKMSGGYMFHTSYSLIWIEMVWEYYLHTADIGTLRYAFEAVKCVIHKMQSCSDESGIIQNPDSYMFIDWTWNGEHNLHHPPKAMGQAPLNAFYYGALKVAVKIAGELGDNAIAGSWSELAKSVKESFNNLFFDRKRAQYFDGLNDKTENVSTFMPANIERRVYSKYTNTLAVLYGLCDEELSKTVLEKALFKENYPDVQPYFMHFVLQALGKCGLFAQYGIEEIRKWEAAVRECDKGMKEAWIIFEGYGFDYSHAWAASPSYHLPDKILGLEILSPGMKKLRLTPNLYGLDSAEIVFPTLYGTISVKLEKDKAPKIIAPQNIEIIITSKTQFLT